MRRFIALASAFAVGCIVFTDLDDVSGGADSALDGGADGDASSSSSSSSGSTAEEAGREAGGGCPSGKGAAMVRTTTFCIDATEATVAQYTQFLADMAALPDRGLSAQPSECAWNADFAPAYWYPRFPTESALSDSEVGELPVAVVDWCDAHAYCKWAGKRLCGAVAGGGALAIDKAGTIDSEWFVACSKNGLFQYPYGNDYASETCNDGKLGDQQGRERVSSNAKCTGGYPALFDMSGNLQEWVNACDAPGADAAASKCALSGGSWNYPGTAVYCGFTDQTERAGAGPQAGIRCCATP